MRKFIPSAFLLLMCIAGLFSFPDFITGQSFFHPATGLVITGDLMHAASGSDFIGAVYSKNGDVYYNQLSDNGTWAGETLLGTGTQARMAIDNAGHPHVVFASSGKIAYLTYNGSAWSSIEYIESNYSGSCSKPDIAVEGNGDAHITYTDTKGNVGNYTDFPDIMYAEKTSEGFVKTLIFNGYLEYYGGADRYAEYFNDGSFISVDISGNYYILTHKYQYQTWMGGNDKQYSIIVKSNLGNGSTAISSSNIFAINDLKFSGNAVFALYKESTFKVSELTVSGANISFNNKQNITASSVSSLALSGTDEVIGGISSTKLFTQFNDLGHIYEDIVVKGTIVSTVEVNDVFFSIYTDNADGMVKIREVAKPLSFTRFWFSQQTGPAIIDGQAGTIKIEVANGTDLANLTASFTTTSDVETVVVGTAEQISGTSLNNFSSPVTYQINGGLRNWIITVTEAPAVYTISTGSNPVEGGTTSGNGEYAEGGNISVSATANEGYEFVCWKEGELVVSTDADYSFVAVANRNLEAVFIKQYTLTIQTTGSGSVEVDDATYTGAITVSSGTILSLKAIANTGYKFVDWSDDFVSTDNPASITIDGNKNVTANFDVITGLDIECSADIEVYPNPFSNTLYLHHGGNVKRVLITNIAGYTVLDILLNGSQTIHTSDLKNGVYFITIELFNGERIVRKMTKY